MGTYNPLSCTVRGTTCKLFCCQHGSYRRKDPDVQEGDSGIRVIIRAGKAASLQAVRARLQAQGDLKPRRSWWQRNMMRDNQLIATDV